jgi:peptidoglycan/LPS O-acetylase OafA/YrhL
MANISDTKGAPASERLHALDAVRGLALILGIVFHAAFSFVPSPVQLWVVRDTHPSATLGVLFFSLHVFRMTTFFLIAGFFAHMSLHRRGLGGFIGDRLKRIAVPLVVAWPVLFGSIIAVSIWATVSAHGGHLPKGPAPAWPKFPGFPLTHLWFLYVLLQFYAAALGLCGLAGLIDRGGALRAGVDRIVAAVVASPFAPLVLAAPVSIAFALDKSWMMWFGVPTPDSSLVTNAVAWTGFGFAFGFGWLLHRQVPLLAKIQQRWALNLAAAVVLVPVAMILAGGIAPRLTPAPTLAIHLAGAVAYALATWTLTLGLIGAALKFLSNQSPVRRYIADASYWLYLIHLPIVMALQVVVAQLAWPWPLKYAVILGVGLPAMLASYELLVRHSFIGRVLNGRRVPWRTSLPTRPASSTPEAGGMETSR